MEIKLHDNSRLHFKWTKSGVLYIQLLRPGNLRDGHGLIVTATAMLSGHELADFLAALTPQQKEAA
jgi:hypothetical protein